MTGNARAVVLTAALLLISTTAAVPANSSRAATTADTGRSTAAAINNRGEIAGWAFTESGQAHSVRWTIAGGGAEDLGTLGGPESRAWGINDLGEIVGESQAASGGWHAFRHTEADGMRQLPDLAGATRCDAVDINDRSEVVGTCTMPIAGGGSRTQAVRWSGGRATALPTYSPTEQTEAHGINDRGEIAGFGDDLHRLTVWTPDNQRIGLPTLPRVSTHGHVPEINDRGQIVLHDQPGESLVGQLWTPTLDGRYVDEPTVIELGSSFGAIGDVNEAAEVVGARATPAGLRGFIWHRGTFTELSPLPGSDESSAAGINDRGEVVGNSRTDSGHRAVAWSDGQIVDLGGLTVPPS